MFFKTTLAMLILQFLLFTIITGPIGTNAEWACCPNKPDCARTSCLMGAFFELLGIIAVQVYDCCESSRITAIAPTTTTTTPSWCAPYSPAAANTGSIILEDPYNQASYIRNAQLYAFTHTCSRYGMVKEFYRAQPTASVYEPQALNVDCNGHNYTNLCICAESGECFQQNGAIGYIEVSAYCDAGGCHTYVELYKGSLIGNRGTRYTYGQQNGMRLGSDTTYLKAVSISCQGCANIQQAICPAP